MKRLLGIFRGWLVPIIVVGVVIAMTVPGTYWLLQAVDERGTQEEVRKLVRELELQLRMSDPATAPQKIWEMLRNEFLANPTVQAVALVDLRGGQHPWLTRGPHVEQPRTLADIDRLVNQSTTDLRLKLTWKHDPGRLREALREKFRRRADRDPTDAELEKETQDWTVRERIGPDLVRAFVYLDISRAALKQRFWALNGPLLRRMWLYAGIAILLLSAVGIFGYLSWRKIGYVRLRAELERAGIRAERGLTAAVLAHEIRNPLAALRFQLHSLRRNAADQDRVNSTADLLDGELSRIQKLVQDYLEHEKAQSMRPQPVDLGDAARTLKSLVDELLRQTRTELIVREPDEPAIVTCDPHMLRQALLNLVLNAQQAMGHGGQITISVGRDADAGTISVSDTGPGIPPEMLERIFKPFQTTRKEGSGIGLALVKRFADNFGGTVSVDSQPGQGTTFHLRLPASGGQ